MPRPKGQTLTEKDIVDAAIGLIEREGESALGVNRVARELGIQPPSLYNHIAGNGALRVAISIEGYRRIAEFVVQQVADVEDPIIALRTSANAQRRFAKRHPRLYAFTTTHPLPMNHPDFAQQLNNELEFYAKLLRPFDLSADDIVHTIRILQASIHGFIRAEQVGLFVLSQPVDESYERMLDTLLSGLLQQLTNHHPNQNQKPDL